MDFVYESVMDYTVPRLTNKSNIFSNIRESAVDLPISTEEVKIYTCIQKSQHQNILHVRDVYAHENGEGGTVSLWKVAVEDDFEAVQNSLHLPFFNAMGNRLDLKTLKVFLDDLLDGLVYLYKIGFYHGNLNTETIYYTRREDSFRPIIKLGGFKSHSNFSIEELMARDLHDLGCVLESVLVRSNSSTWSNEGQFVELKDLIKCLKEGQMNVYTESYGRLNATTKPSLWKLFIFGHVGMLDFEDRPSFILSATSYVETEELSSKISDENVKLLNHDLVIDKALLPELIACKGVSCDFPSLPVGRRGWPYVLAERNLISHKIKKSQRCLRRKIGSTSRHIDVYFSFRSNVVLALYKAVKGTRFKFVNFRSRNHEAFRL